MGFPTKVQLISRKASEQWYINFPSAIAQAMEFSKGETVEWVHRRQSPSGVASPRSAGSGSKKNSAGILPQFEQLWKRCIPAFDQQRVSDRAQTLAMSSLLCLGRHTVTGLLTTSGSQFQDWSATYRLFSQDRVPVPEIFSVVRRAIAGQLPAGAPFRAVLDDSLLRRSGTHTPGVGWRRDPLGPRFQTNFVRAQRFLQISRCHARNRGRIPFGSYCLSAHAHAAETGWQGSPPTRWRNTVWTPVRLASVCAPPSR